MTCLTCSRDLHVTKLAVSSCPSEDAYLSYLCLAVAELALVPLLHYVEALYWLEGNDPDGSGGQLQGGNFILLAGSTFVHLCGSKV